MKYPQTRAAANRILNAVRGGMAATPHLVRYCLLMTGDMK